MVKILSTWLLNAPLYRIFLTRSWAEIQGWTDFDFISESWQFVAKLSLALPIQRQSAVVKSRNRRQTRAHRAKSDWFKWLKTVKIISEGMLAKLDPLLVLFDSKLADFYKMVFYHTFSA